MKRNLFLLLLASSVMMGCVTQKRCSRRFPPVISSETIIRSDTVVTVRDSLIPLPPDSGLIRALLECREGKVVVREIMEVSPGKRVIPFLSLENNILTTGAKIDSSAIWFAWKETHIRELISKVKTIEKPVYRVTGFQQFLIWSGGISWGLIILVAGFFLVRFFLRRKILP